MKKLRFKNRNDILYFGIDDKFKSSKLKYSNINKNIIINKFKSGKLDEELGISSGNIDVPLITELLDDVISEKSKVLKHKSIISYKSTCKNHIVPYFKGKLVSEIKPIDIKKFQDKLVENGLNKDSLNFARILLREVFDLAIIGEFITINPITMVKMPKFKNSVDKKQLPCTLDEIDLILADTKGQLRNFLGISFFTGMRSGEILALKWEDIDFETETISINKTIASGLINSPKTQSSLRDIEMLEQAKVYLKLQRLETGLNDSYVFLNAKGLHNGSNTYYYKQFQKVLERNGITAKPLHCTRHTFASMMLNNGIDTMWVSHTLGHESVNVTLNVYAHFMPKKEKMSIGFLEKRYKNGTNII